MKAALSGDLSGAEGFTTEKEQQAMNQIEKQIKRRLPIGVQTQEGALVKDLMKQNYQDRIIYKVIYCMIRKGELQFRQQRKQLFRLK